LVSKHYPHQPCGIYGIQAKTNWALMIVLPLSLLLAPQIPKRKILLDNMLPLG